MTSDTFDRNGAGERSVLRLERRYPHPLAKVWQAVTTPEHLDRWFPSRVHVDLRVGGEIRFTDDPNMPNTTGRVTDLEPPRLLAFTWEDDHLRFELSEDGDGTLFRLVHAFRDTAGAASFASGWESCLEDLEAVVDGREPGRRRPGAADHERFVKEFHLDEGTIEPADGDWRVRFERQLTQPEAEVRAALATWPDGVWELRQGTGHGPRLVVTDTAATEDDAKAACATWKSRIDQLADAAR